MFGRSTPGITHCLVVVSPVAGMPDNEVYILDASRSGSLNDFYKHIRELVVEVHKLWIISTDTDNPIRLWLHPDRKIVYRICEKDPESPEVGKCVRTFRVPLNDVPIERMSNDVIGAELGSIS